MIFSSTNSPVLRAQRLHHPQIPEIAITHDMPWEGSGSGYHSIFKDGDKYRMYYKSWQLTVTGWQGEHRRASALHAATRKATTAFIGASRNWACMSSKARRRTTSSFPKA
jgi:hypothetical protein